MGALFYLPDFKLLIPHCFSFRAIYSEPNFKSERGLWAYFCSN